MDANYKTCPRCELTKPLNQWNRNKARKDGLSTYCTSCVRENNSVYNGKPEVKVKRSMKNDLYHRTLEGRYHLLKANAKYRGLKMKLSLEQYKKVVAKGTCEICGAALPKRGAGLDRLRNRYGYSPKNVWALCERCNASKGTRSRGYLLKRRELLHG